VNENVAKMLSRHFFWHVMLLNEDFFPALFLFTRDDKRGKLKNPTCSVTSIMRNLPLPVSKIVSIVLHSTHKIGKKIHQKTFDPWKICL
jgi:hypothetical protein